MTSRNFSSDDRKRRLYMGFVSLFYVFLDLLASEIQIQNTQVTSFGDNMTDWLAVVIKFCEPSLLVLIMVIILAILYGYSGYFYLHSRQQTDMYHALPVTRKSFYHHINKNSLMLFLTALMVDEIGLGILACSAKVFCEEILISLVIRFIIVTLVFLVSYYVAVLAIILTGNIFTSVCGVLVFQGYAPVVLRLLYPVYADTFFETYWSPDSIELPWLNYFSPTSLCTLFQSANASILGHFAKGAPYFNMHNLIICGIHLLGIIVLSTLCKILYCKRASENAGSSMAFPKTKAIIRLLLVVPLSLYTGILLYDAVDGIMIGWLIGGIVLGCIFFHGMIEVIYQNDFHGLISKPIQLIFTMAITLGISALFWADPLHYDSWMPSAIAVNSMDVSSSNTDNSYYYWGKGDFHLSKEDSEIILTYLKDLPKYESQDDSDSNYYYTLLVKYHMANHSVKTRSYAVSKEDYCNIMSVVYDSKEGKEAYYSILSADYDKITEIYFNSIGLSQHLDLSKEDQKKFLDLYCEELSSLTYEDLLTTEPINRMTIVHNADDTDYDDDSYPILASFTKTIAFLKEKGLDISQPVSTMNISQILVYNNQDQTEDNYVISDQEKIKEFQSKLYLSDYYDYFSDSLVLASSTCPDYITVNVKSSEAGLTENEFVVYTDGDTVNQIMANASKE